MNRTYLVALVVVAGCNQGVVGDPAGANNFDDPFDPGQSGANVNGPDATTDANGRFCVGARDCPAVFVCAYPITDACGAVGRCLPYTLVAGCDVATACGCDNSAVSLCAPPGYALKAVKSQYPCEGGTTTDAASDAPSDVTAQ